MSSRRKTVFITGATDGIGLSLTRFYHQSGCRLLLTGRKPLESLGEPFFSRDTYCQADLAGDGYRERILAFLERNAIDALDICIQNAATGYYGATAEQSPDSIREVVAVNLTAPMHLSHALLPRLSSGDGRLVFVSSIASYLPCPRYAVYAATKSALNGLARSLRVETEGRIRVQVIHPGATRTGFHSKAGVPLDRLTTEAYPSADRVAAEIARRIDVRRAETVIGARNGLLVWLGRHFRGPLEFMARRATS